MVNFEQPQISGNLTGVFFLNYDFFNSDQKETENKKKIV